MTDDEYPVLLHFESAEHPCDYYAPLDHRCQNVVVHYDQLNMIPVPREHGPFSFHFGYLKFLVFLTRMFQFRHFNLVDYKLVMEGPPGQPYPKDLEHRLCLLFRHDQANQVYSAAGWFSFVIFEEYYSFNFVNHVEGEYPILKQHWGPNLERQFWDRFWRDISDPRIGMYEKEEWIPENKRTGRTESTTSAYDPDKERKLKWYLRSEDGLFQNIVLQRHHNYSMHYNYLLINGHRNWNTVSRISVTFQFSYKFMQHQGIYNYQNEAMALLATRTINELNAFFKRSGTLIKLHIHCIEVAQIIDACCIPSSQVLDAYSKPKERKSSDLLIAFVQELEDTTTISYPYRLDEKIAAVIVRSSSVFEVYDIAHEIGHVLGAGHTPDLEYDPDYKPLVFYGQGYIDHVSRKCTIMSPMPCIMQPLFSTPRNRYQNHTYGRKHWQDNSAWIKQNRFVWKAVGNEDQKCKQGESMPYIPWLFKCFDKDLTNPITSKGVFRAGANQCTPDIW